MFEELLTKLESCVKKNDLNFSSVREEVLKIILEHEEALCSEAIHKKVNEIVQKKVSYNTVYRVLRLLEECKIVLTIQSDIKKTHYVIANPQNGIYLLDDNKVTTLAGHTSSALLEELGLKDSNSFIVIHKK